MTKRLWHHLFGHPPDSVVSGGDDILQWVKCECGRWLDMKDALVGAEAPEEETNG